MPGRGGVNKGGRARGGGGGGGEDRLPGINDGCIEVVFLEDPMRYFKMLPSIDECISPSFLDEVLIESYRRWSPYLPGVRAVDLVARGVPTLPLNGSTYREWNGVVVVELKEEMVDLGLLCQVSRWRAKGIEADMRLNTALKTINEKLEDVRNEAAKTLQQSLEDLKEHKRLLEEHERRHEEHDRRHEELERRHEEHEQLIVKMQLESNFAMEELRKQIRLTNQIKRRVTLEKARAKIIRTLEKEPLAAGQKWRDYFDQFDAQAWTKVFGTEKDQQKISQVKNILMVGSINANKSIHEIQPEEIFDSIMATEVGTKQAAWLWLFDHAFPDKTQQLMESLSL